MPLDLSVVITSFNSSTTLVDTIESLLKLKNAESPLEMMAGERAPEDPQKLSGSI